MVENHQGLMAVKREKDSDADLRDAIQDHSEFGHTCWCLSLILPFPNKQEASHLHKISRYEGVMACCIAGI